MAGLQKLKWEAPSNGTMTLLTFPPATITFNGNVVKQVKHSDGTILWGKYNCYSAAEEIDYVIRDAWDSWVVRTGDDISDIIARSSQPAEGVNAKRTLEEDLVYTPSGTYPSHPVYHGEQVTLEVCAAQGWNFGIDEIDQATAYWITSKQMTKTVEGDISWQLSSDWIPERNYLQALTFTGSGCTLSSFKRNNSTWTNGSKATCGSTITFTATPSSTGMFPSGTQTYYVQETAAANTNKWVSFYSVWPVSYSGSWTNYGPSSTSKFKNNTSSAGFADGAYSASIKVALYTNNTSWVNMNSIKCNSKTPSATTAYNPSYVTLSPGGTLSISKGAQASGNSSAQIYGLYYYNSKLYQITLKTNTTATVTMPSVTYNEGTIASQFGWSYDRSNESLEFNTSNSWFLARNPTNFTLRFRVVGYVRYTDTSGATRTLNRTTYTNAAANATNKQLNVPGSFSTTNVPSRNVEISYVISVYIANSWIKIAETDAFH